MDGWLGANIRLGSGGGASTDNALRALRVMGGRYHVVINDDVDKQPTSQYPNEKPLSRHIIEAGGIVAVRFTLSTPHDNARDDDADAKFRGDELARIHVDAMNQIGKHENLFGYGGNELGSVWDRQEEFLVTYLDTLGHNGYRGVIGNYSYKRPEEDAFEHMPRAVAAIKRWKAIVGFHEGTVDEARTYEAAVAYEAIGRAVRWREKYGFDVWLTEFAGSADAHNGYRVLYRDDPELWHQVLYKTVANIASKHRIPVDIYCMFQWQTGFHIYDDTALLEEVGSINRLFPVQEIAPVATRLDMMHYVCPPNGKQLRLFGLGDEHAQCTQETDGWVLQRKNELSEEFQVTASRIRRGADTSSLYTPDGQYKGFFYIQYTKQSNGSLDYGCDWCPRYMEPGETFIRNAHIVELYHDGRVKAEYDATTTLTFVQFHASFTDPQSGIALKNVIELHWGGEEHYYYAEGYGLIRWWNVRENYGSWLGTLNNVSIRQPIPHPRPRPVVPFPTQGVPTTPTVVTPANPGAGVMMTVNTRDGLKHRADGDTGATILRTLLYQQPVMAYPATKKVADGWTWIFCTTATGEPGWSAASYLSVVTQPEPWTVKRNTPYVSQQGSEAAKSPNDCRVATLLMLERDWFQETLKRVPSVPTVDDLVKYTRLSNPTPPKGLDFADVDTLAKQTGFDVDYVQPMTTEKIVAYLDQGKPVSVLVDYSKYNPAGAAIAHEVAVIGYSDNAFLTHDPYLLGSNVTITKAKLAEAMKSSPGNSVGFQGFVLSDVA